MAFVSWGEAVQASADLWRIGGLEVRDVVEKLMRSIWKEVEGIDLPSRFDVMTYTEAMNRVSYPVHLSEQYNDFLPQFGSDKPDVRFDLFVSAKRQYPMRWYVEDCLPDQ
jgi:aspartyl-tRNA synthetase